jgi:hypothetical protein
MHEAAHREATGFAMAEVQQTEIAALAYNLTDAARLSGVSKATLYRAASDGKLTIRKARGRGAGRSRSVILAEELREWLKSLPAMGSA